MPNLFTYYRKECANSTSNKFKQVLASLVVRLLKRINKRMRPSILKDGIFYNLKDVQEWYIEEKMEFSHEPCMHIKNCLDEKDTFNIHAFFDFILNNKGT